MVKSAVDELDEIQRHSAKSYVRVMKTLVGKIVDGGSRIEPLGQMAGLLGQTMALSDLYGRRRLLLEMDWAVRHQRERFAGLDYAPGSPYFEWQDETPVVPHKTFDEAIENLVTREPRLARSASAVAELYATRHAFALARSTEQNLTEWVQDYINRSLREGRSVPDAAEAIAAAGDFTNAYAETVYRTNVATAYSAGRFAQANDPDVAQVIGAFELETAGDADVRDNHAAAGGLLAAQNDPVWNVFAPPLGYRCRCNLRLVTVDELRSTGRLGADGRVKPYFPPSFHRAHPDPGFGRGRPDIRVYTGVVS